MKIDGGMLSLLLDQEASLAISGADDDADKDGKSNSDDQDKKDGKSGESEKKEGQDGKSGEDGKTDKVELTDPSDIRAWNNFKEERDRLHGKVRTAEEERDAAIKERDDLKAKGATDDDAKQQMTAITTERDALLTTVSDLRIENAVLKTSGYDWQNPAAAIRLLDLSSIDVDKGGKVVQTSLKTALDALVKENPFLLKPKSENNDDKDENKDAPKKTGDPAPQSRQTNNDKDKQARETTLRNKYPALRR